MIWIPKSAGHSFSSAKKFGEARFVFEDSRDLFNPELLLERARGILQNSNPADFILLSGPQLMNIAVVFAFQERHGQVNLLLFQPRTDDYCVRVLTTKEVKCG